MSEWIPLEGGVLDLGIYLDHEPTADELAQIRADWSESTARRIRVSWANGEVELP